MILIYILAAIGAAAVLFIGALVLAGLFGWWLDWDDRRTVARFKERMRKMGA